MRKGWTPYRVTRDGYVKIFNNEHNAMLYANNISHLYKSVTITVNGKLLAEWHDHKLVHYKPLEWD